MKYIIVADDEESTRNRVSGSIAPRWKELGEDTEIEAIDISWDLVEDRINSLKKENHEVIGILIDILGTKGSGSDDSTYPGRDLIVNVRTNYPLVPVVAYSSMMIRDTYLTGLVMAAKPHRALARSEVIVLLDEPRDLLAELAEITREIRERGSGQSSRRALPSQAGRAERVAENTVTRTLSIILTAVLLAIAGWLYATFWETWQLVSESRAAFVLLLALVLLLATTAILIIIRSFRRR